MGYLIALKFGKQKGGVRHQVWLEYDKHSQSYLQSFMKNNTNMLSCPQGKLRMARS